MYINTIPDNTAFDYVIVGAGSAGCVLADKLSANGKHSVLLLEAGGRDTSFNSDLGCEGWGYSDLMPIFKRLEDFPEGDQSVRGSGGPIHCTLLTKFDPLSDAFLDSAC